MIVIAAEVLESLHLGTQSLAASHVMLVAMCICRIVAATDVITEMGVVQTCRADHPIHYLINMLV